MLILVLGGCVHTVRFPPDLWPDDSGWDTGLDRRNRGDDDDDTTGPTEVPVSLGVERIQGGCDVADTAWTWIARTNGWVGFGMLNVFRTSDDQAEQHSMSIVASDPAGAWDELRVGPLPDGVDPEVQTATVDSRFDCALDSDTLSYVVRLRDGDGVLIDCVVWGADPHGATARIRNLDPDILALGGCRLVQVEES